MPKLKKFKCDILSNFQTMCRWGDDANQNSFVTKRDTGCQLPPPNCCFERFSGEEEEAFWPGYGGHMVPTVK